MLVLDRRTFVLGLAATSLVGLPPVPEAQARAAHPERLVRLGRRRIVVLSSFLAFPLRREQDVSDLVIRTEASGYWMDSVELTDARGNRSSQVISRRVLPRSDFELALRAIPSNGWSSVILHHAYLPLTFEQASIDVWARAS